MSSEAWKADAWEAEAWKALGRVQPSAAKLNRTVTAVSDWVHLSEIVVILRAASRLLF